MSVKWLGESLQIEGEIKKYKDLNPFASGQYETRPKISMSILNRFKNVNFSLFSNYTKFAFDKSYNPFNKQKEITRKSSIYMYPEFPTSNAHQNLHKSSLYY